MSILRLPLWLYVLLWLFTRKQYCKTMNRLDTSLYWTYLTDVIGIAKKNKMPFFAINWLTKEEAAVRILLREGLIEICQV